MERVKRRWWTWAITLLAAVVIAGAVISGLFQLAVLTLPSYRADLSAWVTHVANRPVQIGGVNLGWHGIEPRLDLTDITLFSDDGDESLTMPRLRLGFKIGRAHVCTPVTNAHLVFRLLLEKKKQTSDT